MPLEVPVLEVANVPEAKSDTSKREELLKELDRALAEANAPVRSDGPNLLTVAGLVVKQIFNLGPRRTQDESSTPTPSDEQQ